jgi:hypothetical protein
VSLHPPLPQTALPALEETRGWGGIVGPTLLEMSLGLGMRLFPRVSLARLLREIQNRTSSKGFIYTEERLSCKFGCLPWASGVGDEGGGADHLSYKVASAEVQVERKATGGRGGDVGLRSRLGGGTPFTEEKGPKVPPPPPLPPLPHCP